MEKLCCDPSENNSLTATSDGSATTMPTAAINDGGDGRQRPSEEQQDQVLECEYDTPECPRLYKLIEERDWDHAMHFLGEGRFYDTSIFSGLLGNGPDSPLIQTCTWVTAFDEDGDVEWCQLPIHAALTFNAPFCLIQKLIEIYPKSVRCADDADMLPLHYAFRFGTSDEVIALLLEKFPQALSKKAIKGRLPLAMAQYGPRSSMGYIIDQCVENAVQDARVVWEEEYDNMFKQLQDSAHTAIYMELQKTKAQLEDTKNRLEQARDQVKLLKEHEHETEVRTRNIIRTLITPSFDDDVDRDAPKRKPLPEISQSGAAGIDLQELYSTRANDTSTQLAPKRSHHHTKKKKAMIPFGRRRKEGVC